MSITMRHNIGYGFRTDNIHIASAERVRALIHLAPDYEAWVLGVFSEDKITDPSLEDYLNLDDDANGIATVLAEVIGDVEHISLTHCVDFDGRIYLIYQPKYPWEISEAEKTLTPEKLDEMLRKYAAIVSDDAIELDYQKVENVG